MVLRSCQVGTIPNPLAKQRRARSGPQCQCPLSTQSGHSSATSGVAQSGVVESSYFR